MMKLNVMIDGRRYSATMENTVAARALMNMLPLELEMEELNGNEKYAYLDSSLPVDAFRLGHIEAGDIMLYGDDCLVIFYKTFETAYAYTRIGHIERLADLVDSAVLVRIEEACGELASGY